MPPDHFAFFNQALTQAYAFILTWQRGIFQWGQPIFWMLATISLGITGAMGILRRDFYGLLEDLMRSILAIAISWWLFLHAADYSRNVLVYTLGAWGGMTGGIPPDQLDPAGIMNQGFQLAFTLFHALSLGTWLSDPLSSMLIVICTLIVALGFGFAAIVILELLVEIYIVCIGETIFIPLALTQYSWHFVQRYINDVLSIGVRLFFTYAILGVGLTMITAWVVDLQNHSVDIVGDMYYAIAAVIETGLFIMMLLYIPRRVAGSIGAAITATLGEVLLGRTAAYAGSTFTSTFKGSSSSSTNEAAESSGGGGSGAVSDTIDKLLLETSDPPSASSAPTAPMSSNAPTVTL